MTVSKNEHVCHFKLIRNNLSYDSKLYSLQCNIVDSQDQYIHTQGLYGFAVMPNIREKQTIWENLQVKTLWIKVCDRHYTTDPCPVKETNHLPLKPFTKLTTTAIRVRKLLKRSYLNMFAFSSTFWIWTRNFSLHLLWKQRTKVPPINQLYFLTFVSSEYRSVSWK